MGTHVIKMPDIGEGIAQVELVEWFVKVGDMIAEDQVVADVMTDKATVEIPSPVSGKVLALGGQPGEVMAVGSELIRIEVEGSGNHADEPHAKPVEAIAAPAPVAAEPRVEPQPVASAATSASVVAPIVPRQASDKPLASPALRKRALDAGIELRYVHGSGPAGRILHEDLDAFISKHLPEAIKNRAPV